jgi:hypothetical protein
MRRDRPAAPGLGPEALPGAGARRRGGGVERRPKRTRKMENCIKLVQYGIKITQRLQIVINKDVNKYS